MNTCTVIACVAPSKQCKVKSTVSLGSHQKFLNLLTKGTRVRDCTVNPTFCLIIKKYCSMRNKVQRIVKQTQSEYIAEQIDANKDDSKKL